MHRNQAAEDEPQPGRRLTPGEELLVDQTAVLIMRTLPHIGSISVTQAVYEYHEGFARIQHGGEQPIQAAASILIRIEREQAMHGGDGRLPVWTWRDKRRLVSAGLRDSDGPADLVVVPYTDPSEIEHMVLFRADPESRAAFLDESAELSAAIARRTLALLKIMVMALEKSPLGSEALLHGDFASLQLGERDLRTREVTERLRLIDQDLPLNAHDPRRLTAAVEQLQRMLAFAENIVFREAAVVGAAMRARFTEVQGKRGAGWSRWLNGSADGTYADGEGPAANVQVPVLVYHDRDRKSLHVVEPAPEVIPGKGRLVSGWEVRAIDAARLLTECDQIVHALNDEWTERHRSLGVKVSGAVTKLQNRRR